MEGAKVYVQDSSSAWHKAIVVDALGSGKYRVQLEPWEEAEGLTSTDESELKALDVDASSMEGGTLPFQNANMPDGGFADMTTLDHLHEAALVHNLRVRFLAGTCPYTYTADIVIAVNPYKWLPEIYTDEKRKEYLVFDRSKLTPHVYATSSAAFSGLQESKVDQSILVSGESGAGKTETVKILMGHLALIASSDDTTVIERIVRSNPLLESFGNAQTVRNDNSSRFGKFIELELNDVCRLVGSRCRTFLLEKSRVVGQDAGERNYHIFYQMLAMDSETRSTFGLGGISRTRDTMRYTSGGKSPIDTIEGKSDSARFEETTAALALVDVKGDVLLQLLRGLAGVLLVGQIDFCGDETSSFTPASAAEASECAAVLQVDTGALEQALTQRTIKAHNDVLVKKLPPSSATAARDALAKELYMRLFDWLVAKICAATTADVCGEHGGAAYSVGLLDIFGFESFAINRFEQLCINYANEKLQQKFTLDIFKAVQQEYADEGIPWERVEFKDNAPVLALIEAKLGIIAMLNEECVRPKGTDENFVSKLLSVHRDDPAFSTPRVGAQKELQFSVRHYAGAVTYTATGWLERNKDVVSDDLLALMRTSANSLVAGVFAESSLGKEVLPTKSNSGANTVVTKFRASLGQLMDTIKKTRTQYVRCIKPNKQKSPTMLDNQMVVEQLRCAGVIEAIRISRAGFPARMPLEEFVRRFRVLLRTAGAGDGTPSGPGRAALAADAAVVDRNTDAVAACRAYMAALAPGGEQLYEIGRTRVYFKTGVLEQFEERRALLRQASATAIARWERGQRARRRYAAIRRAVFRLQAGHRMHRSRCAFAKARSAAILCQAQWRGLVARRRATVLRREFSATRLQAFQRRRVSVQSFQRARTAAVRVQSSVRRSACRRRYLVQLAEFKEQAKLENQVRALQAKLAEQEKVANAPPTEVLEALHTLTSENAKLREELERTRAENATLRRENQELRASQSTRTDWLNFLRSRKAPPPTEEDRPCPSTTPTVSTQADEMTEGGSTASACNAVAAEAAPPRPSLQFYPPLSEFWGDMPCSELPMLMSGTEVHIKFGANLLLVDDVTKHLMWQSWMPSAKGYRRSMSFSIERRAERLSVSRGSVGSMDEEPIGPGDPLDRGRLGLAFALRSVLTSQYVCVGGMLKGYCMQVNGERPEDAAVFTFVPQEGSHKSGSVESHLFALRLLSENKLLSLRKDGYVSMTAVADKDNGFVDDTMAASIECLLPCTSYEITVYEKQIGIIVGKELPLQVVGFRPNQENGTPEPGPAERTGRVHVGDIITRVNGIPLDNAPRDEAMALITGARPVNLSFAVADESNGV